MISTLDSLWTSALAGLAIGLAVSALLRRWTSGRTVGHGPWGVPILGHLPRLGKKPHLRMQEWSKIYGNLYFIRMGMWPTLVVNGTKSIRSILKDHGRDVSDRPAWATFQCVAGGKSIAFGSGSQYLSGRRLMHMGLYRFEKRHSELAEEVSSEETLRMVNSMLAETNSPRSTSDHLGQWMSSILFSLLHSRPSGWFERNLLDATAPFARAAQAVQSLEHSMDSLVLCLVDMVPPTGRLFCGRLSEFNNVAKVVDASVSEMARCDAETRVAGEAPRCLSDEFSDVCDDAMVRRLLSDMMGASLSTTVSVARWILYYLTMYPEWQERVSQEMHERLTAGRRSISWAEREKLPQLRGFLAEVFRHSCGLLFLLPHCATRDFTTECGILVPKGTIILCNMWSACRDAEIWTEPDVFKPLRFMDAEGNFDEAIGAAYPVFGAGFRKCVGSKLAQQLLYNFIIRLVGECKLECPTGKVPFDYKVNPLGLEAPEFPLRVVRRCSRHSG